MTLSDDELRALAMAATPWDDEIIEDSCAECRRLGTAEYFISNLAGGVHSTFGDKTQALLIAAANPAAILSLLDRIADLHEGRVAVLPKTVKHARNLYLVAVGCLRGYGEDPEARISTLEAENKRLREALTPSGATKNAYMGEFYFKIDDRDEDGNECRREVMVPWTTIKEIMNAIENRALENSHD